MSTKQPKRPTYKPATSPCQREGRQRDRKGGAFLAQGNRPHDEAPEVRSLESRIRALERRDSSRRHPPTLIVRDGDTVGQAWARQVKQYGPPAKLPHPVVIIPAELAIGQWETEHGFQLK